MTAARRSLIFGAILLLLGIIALFMPWIEFPYLKEFSLTHDTYAGEPTSYGVIGLLGLAGSFLGGLFSGGSIMFNGVALSGPFLFISMVVIMACIFLLLVSLAFSVVACMRGILSKERFANVWVIVSSATLFGSLLLNNIVGLALDGVVSASIWGGSGGSGAPATVAPSIFAWLIMIAALAVMTTAMVLTIRARRSKTKMPQLG